MPPEFSTEVQFSNEGGENAPASVSLSGADESSVIRYTLEWTGDSDAVMASITVDPDAVASLQPVFIPSM